jgi:hypothetical protein
LAARRKQPLFKKSGAKTFTPFGQGRRRGNAHGPTSQKIFAPLFLKSGCFLAPL